MTVNSLNEMFERSFKENWNRPAICNYGQEVMSYRDLSEKIAKMHILFEACGIQKGDRIALCSKNQANWGLVFLATLSYGAVIVPLMHEFKPANVQHLTAHSEAKILFAEESVWEQISSLELEVPNVVKLTSMTVAKDGCGKLASTLENLNDLFAQKYKDGFKQSDVVYHRDESEELAIINYTSGTSGFSKGVMIPYRSLVSNVHFAMEVEPQMNNQSKVVSMLPTAHMYGLMFEFLFEICIGAEIFFLVKLPSPKIILGAMADVKPSIVIAVPLVIEKIYKQMIAPVISKPAVKAILAIPLVCKIVETAIRKKLVKAFGGQFHEAIVGGAAFNKEAEAFMKRIKFPLTVGYGMTECGPIISYVAATRTRLLSCGKAAPRMEIRIDSEDQQHIAGEILVKGENVFLGYYKNEEATAKSFTSDGWFRTGDMGVIDKDGYLYIKGRSKSMILGPSGQNIYPEEIEDALNNLPYVVESLVIDDGGRIVALVYPDYAKAKEDGLSNEALEAKMKENVQIANSQLPVYCKISAVRMQTEEFEKTPKKSIKRYLYQK